MTVVTLYGTGFKLEEREDGLNVVKFNWGTGYLNSSDLLTDFSSGHSNTIPGQGYQLKRHHSAEVPEITLTPSIFDLNSNCIESGRRDSSFFSLSSADVDGNEVGIVENDQSSDFNSDSTLKVSLDVGSAYIQQYIFIGVWIALLVSNWFINKIWCALGYPSICKEKQKHAFAVDEVFLDLEALLLYGFVMAWICNLTKRARFRSLFSKKRWYFFVIFYITPIIFSAFMEIPDFQISLSSNADYSKTETIVLFLFGVSILVVLGWHFHFAIYHRDFSETLVYIVSRSAIILFYLVNVVIIVINDDKYIVDFHHYLVAFSLCTVCQFDHIVSLIMLAVCAGIFVQGVAVDEYSSLFSERVNCMGNQSQTTYLNVSADEHFYAKFCLVDSSGHPELKTPEVLIVNNEDEWEGFY